MEYEEIVMDAENFAEWFEFLTEDEEDSIREGECVTKKGRVHYIDNGYKKSVIGISVMFYSDLDKLKRLVEMRNGLALIDLLKVHSSSVPILEATIRSSKINRKIQNPKLENASVGDFVESSIFFDDDRGIYGLKPRFVNEGAASPHIYSPDSAKDGKTENNNEKSEKDTDPEGSTMVFVVAIGTILVLTLLAALLEMSSYYLFGVPAGVVIVASYFVYKFFNLR